MKKLYAAYVIDNINSFGIKELIASGLRNEEEAKREIERYFGRIRPEGLNVKAVIVEYYEIT
jgi:hypothetical protein